MFKKYVTEFVGTLILVLSICLTGHPLVIGATLIAIIYWGGPISGAQYNPAVTLSFWMLDKITIGQAMAFVGVQLAGAILGAGLSTIIIPDIVIPATNPGASTGTLFAAEVAFTFLLVGVICLVAHYPKTEGNKYYGVAISAAVVIGIYAVADISGAVFNPAVGTGPQLIGNWTAHYSLKDVPLYYVAPVTGSILATLFFKYFLLKPAKKSASF